MVVQSCELSPLSDPVKLARFENVSLARQSPPEVLNISQSSHRLWGNLAVPGPARVGHGAGQEDSSINNKVVFVFYFGLFILFGCVVSNFLSVVSIALAPVMSLPLVAAPPSLAQLLPRLLLVFYLDAARRVDMKSRPALRSPSLHETLVNCKIVNLPVV